MGAAGEIPRRPFRSVQNRRRAGVVAVCVAGLRVLPLGATVRTHITTVYAGVTYEGCAAPGVWKRKGVPKCKLPQTHLSFAPLNSATPCPQPLLCL